MSPLPFKKNLALLCLLLSSACATSTPIVPEALGAPDVVYSWAEARTDPSCVVPLCDSERCAIWRCQDVVEAEAHSVMLAQATAPAPMLRIPPRVGNPSRWWGLPLAAPTGVDPVFEIPWHNWKTREQLAFNEQLAFKESRYRCLTPPREPYEKHHIFPQQDVLAHWFASRQIDIHAFTIRVPKSFHQWLHSGGPEGGQWNEAWRQFRNQHLYTLLSAHREADFPGIFDS